MYISVNSDYPELNVLSSYEKIQIKINSTYIYMNVYTWSGR